MFVFGDFNTHHKDWLSYSGGTDRSGEHCYNFPISNDLTQMINFPTWIPDSNSHSPALLYLSLSSDASICFFFLSLSLHWEFLIILLSQFPLTFYHIHKVMPSFIVLIQTILTLNRMVFMIMIINILRISASAVLLVNFVS